MIDYQLNKISSLSLSPEEYFPWVKEVIRLEGAQTGNILYHFCNDEFLLQINRNFLHHDYFTDIITFPLSSDPHIISAEIFISIDRVLENSQKMRTSFPEEFARVLIHGVLHLLGYDDHTHEEKKEMRSKEDYYLSLLPQK